MSHEVRVEIYGQVYSLRTDLDPAYVEELAQEIDARMRALAEQTDTVDTRRLAVLAALLLADEREQFRRERDEQASALPREMSSRLEACNRLLDAVLAGEPRD